ncbi:Uncharacterised protein [Vibrio cholerae]|nr:Uncharacterised protein [Vibrio cholerae]CSI56581.1 Uncharacterised protein [Vibrio cholerae]
MPVELVTGCFLAVLKVHLYGPDLLNKSCIFLTINK